MELEIQMGLFCDGPYERLFVAVTESVSLELTDMEDNRC